MLKKLSEEQQNHLLEIAIEEFGQKGPEKTSVSRIAEAAGVSVGVIYKYYANKEDLFQACLEQSLQILGNVIRDSFSEERGFYENIESLIRACIIFVKNHPSYMRMYHAITVRQGEPAREYARRIESISAEIYTAAVKAAADRGELRKDIDVRSAAFFFDNLLMMLHFSYGCDYYEERKLIYCGEEVSEERLVEQFMLFLSRGIFVSD